MPVAHEVVHAVLEVSTSKATSKIMFEVETRRNPGHGQWGVFAREGCVLCGRRQGEQSSLRSSQIAYSTRCYRFRAEFSVLGLWNSRC